MHIETSGSTDKYQNNNIGIGIEQFVVRITLSHITFITIVRYLIERLELKEYLYSLRRFI